MKTGMAKENVREKGKGKEESEIQKKIIWEIDNKEKWVWSVSLFEKKGNQKGFIGKLIGEGERRMQKSPIIS